MLVPEVPPNFPSLIHLPAMYTQFLSGCLHGNSSIGILLLLHALEAAFAQGTACPALLVLGSSSITRRRLSLCPKGH